MATWTLDVGEEYDLLTGPGSRWCSLYQDGRPCHPSIEGTADEWLLIAAAIEAGVARAYLRVAYAPADLGRGGAMWSPRNRGGPKGPFVELTAAELADLVRSIRDQLAPARGVTMNALIEHMLAPEPAAPVHPPADDGSGPTTGAAYRCLTCGDNGYVLGGVGNSPDEQAEDPCPDCGPAARLPAGRPPGVPTSAPPAEPDLRVVAEDVYACATSWEPDARLIGNVRAADVARLARSVAIAGKAPTHDLAGDPNGPACPCEPGKLDPECIHQVEQDDRDADAIVRVLHRGFLPALRKAIDRIVTPPGAAARDQEWGAAVGCFTIEGARQNREADQRLRDAVAERLGCDQVDNETLLADLNAILHTDEEGRWLSSDELRGFIRDSYDKGKEVGLSGDVRATKLYLKGAAEALAQEWERLAETDSPDDVRRRAARDIRRLAHRVEHYSPPAAAETQPPPAAADSTGHEATDQG
jgi:hypothetical protein